MDTKTIDYQIQSESFKGFIAYPKIRENAPAVLICHAWFGQDEFAREKAKELAELGYLGFALDVYGEGKQAKSREEANELMQKIITHPEKLLQRLEKGLEVLKALPGVDKTRVAAIGFCFGGLCALTLARSGADLKGIVTFHGLLKPLDKVKKGKITSSILVLHGYDDPMVSQDDIKNFQKEVEDQKVDWRFVMYGNTMHAFMTPDQHAPELGLQYNPKTAERAWLEMKNFFKEIL